MSPQKRPGVIFEGDADQVGRLQDGDDTLREVPDMALAEGYGDKVRYSKGLFADDLTALDEAKTPKGDLSSLILDDLDETAQKSGLLAQMDALKGTKFEDMDLIMMDGGMKSVKTRFTEEGGRMYESVSVESIPELDRYLEERLKVDEKVVEDKKQLVYEESEIDIPVAVKSPKSPTMASEKSAEGPRSATPFGDFLDIMEIF